MQVISALFIHFIAMWFDELVATFVVLKVMVCQLVLNLPRDMRKQIQKLRQRNFSFFFGASSVNEFWGESGCLSSTVERVFWWASLISLSVGIARSSFGETWLRASAMMAMKVFSC